MSNTRIDWKNHFVELVVVFIGITLAFMLNNWRESYKNKNLEKKYLASFYSDISADIRSLDSLIRFEEGTLRDAQWLIASLEKEKIKHDSILMTLGKMGQYEPFHPVLVTYESIKNSGNLSIISNYELKQDLIKDYQKFAEINLAENLYFDYFREYFTPFVMNNVDINDPKIVDQNVVRSIRFKNLIAGASEFLRQNISLYREIRQLASDLRDRLPIEK